MAEQVLFLNRKPHRPATFEEYRSGGGYEALKKAVRHMAPKNVTTTVLESGLQGRGGAGFPTGRKWGGVPDDGPHPRYVQCNADEMEPGTVKDRSLVNADPHLVIEGMILCAYAVGASKGICFIRPSYELEAELLATAVAEAKAHNLLGQNILGTDFSFDITVHRSGGRYICGESSAQVRAVQGFRANPIETGFRSAVRGVWGMPTVLNNMETLACVPGIIRNGAEWFKGLAATPESAGTKLYPVSGQVAAPGCFELPMGTPLQEIIFEHAGGMLPGKRFKAALPGGASTVFIPEKFLDLPMDFASLKKHGFHLGTGAVIVFDQDTCLVAATLNMLHFFTRESCGWCTPCRDGLPWLVDLLTRIEAGEGREEDITSLRRTAQAMDYANCSFASGAVAPLLGLLDHFKDEVMAHVAGHACPFKSQPALPWTGDRSVEISVWPGAPEGVRAAPRPRPKPRRIVSCPI